MNNFVSAPLPPELGELEERYNQLIDAVESKAMSVDQAMRTLVDLKVIDGAGILWGMNPEGDFIAGEPGGEQAVTSPTRFKPAQLPMRPEDSARAPWDSQGLMNPPSGDNLHRDGLMNPPGFGGPELTGGGEFVDYGNDTEVPRAPKLKKPKSLKTPKLSVSKPKLGGGGRANSIIEKLKSNQRTLIIILIAIIAVSAIVLTQGKGDEETPSSIPSATLEDMPSDGGAAPVEGAPIPGQDRVNALVSALTSGKRDLAAAAVNNPGDATAIAFNTAKYVGYTEAYGFVLSVGPVAASETGAVADISVTDTATSSVVLTGKANMVPGEAGTWLLSEWPALA